MKKILKIIKIIIIIVLVFFALFFGILLINRAVTSIQHLPIAPVTVTDKTVEITMEIENPANFKQHTAYVELMANDGKLYFYRYPSNEFLMCDKYTQWLCVFENGTVRKIREFDIVPFFMLDGFYYYQEYDPDIESTRSTIYCFDVKTESESRLFSTDSVSSKYSFSSDGTVYFLEDDNFSMYREVRGDKIGKINKMREEYTLKSGTYYVEGSVRGEQDVVVYNQSGEKKVLDIPYGKKSLIPCNNGLLVHNEGQGDLLYLIEGDSGKLTELFTCECMVSESAVNVYQDQAFLSFKRYEKHGEFGMLRFENDTLEGTYCIDLGSGQCEKISDKIYNGLYIFDDTGIYACDENSNIYKLDYDANVIDTLVE